uniref:Uncharacterized protein n=1 Tax=Panagrellus redivivus TaxID=6233 RepID=A0A7E4VEZ5_PANRE
MFIQLEHEEGTYAVIPALMTHTCAGPTRCGKARPLPETGRLSRRTYCLESRSVATLPGLVRGTTLLSISLHPDACIDDKDKQDQSDESFLGVI